MSIWTDDRKARVADLWKAGASAALIADRLNEEWGLPHGFKLTRNAVIGTINRMGLSRSVPATPDEIRAARREREAAARKAARIAQEARDALEAPRVAQESEPAPAVKSEGQEPDLPGRALADLRAGQCRYAITPHGAPSDGHRFCGAPALPGKSWCTEHHAVVFSPPSKHPLGRIRLPGSLPPMPKINVF